MPNHGGNSNITAVRRYQKKHDAIMIRPTIKEGKMIRESAATEGMSVQAFLLKLYREYTVK